MGETADEAIMRAAGSVIDVILDDRLPASAIPLGCAVRVAGEWCGFEGLTDDGDLTLSRTDHACTWTYTPTDGELFVWAAPF